ncbi:hypothetical protein HDV02_002564 [Globomyces sp. JEL0801]|nr:hypothetical protein HDV02_002564 [Globomyces sp. JEL0801]
MAPKNKKKFIDPKNSTTFAVVHRSQRDARIADEEASKYRKGFRPDWHPDDVVSPELLGEEMEDDDDEEEDWFDEDILDDDDLLNEYAIKKMSNGNELNQKDMVAYDGFEKRVGTQDPSNYGVYFKNQDDYDYLQHLKPIGQDPSAVLVEPKHVKPETLEDGENLDLQMKKKLNLPSSALASNQELDIGLLNQVENPLGNQIDLDPSLREILTALDDEAYVENDLEDDFFDAFHMDSMPEKYQALENQVYEEPEDVEQEPWMREFKKSDFSEGTEKPYVKSRGARTATTSFSMSSSAMFRNEKLTLLDDQFDKLLEEYSDDEIGELDAEDEEVLGTLNVSGLALEETLEEKRLDEMFDDFLGNLKVIGNRRRVVTRDPSESLSAIRTELKQEAAEVVHQYSVIEDVDVVDIPMPFPEKKEKERWDCESVLTMNTNIYNRPKLIQEISKGVPKIRLRKGMPSVVPEPTSESESESASEPERLNKGQARAKQETKEEKRARKAAIKQERKMRRMTKKATKTAFEEEKERQIKLVPNHKLQAHSIHIQ